MLSIIALNITPYLAIVEDFLKLWKVQSNFPKTKNIFSHMKTLIKMLMVTLPNIKQVLQIWLTGIIFQWPPKKKPKQFKFYISNNINLKYFYILFDNLFTYQKMIINVFCPNGILLNKTITVRIAQLFLTQLNKCIFKQMPGLINYPSIFVRYCYNIRMLVFGLNFFFFWQLMWKILLFS